MRRGPAWIDTFHPATARRVLRRWIERRSRQTGAPPALRLGVLGPAKTSSDMAARSIAGLLPPSVEVGIELFSTFDGLLEWILAGVGPEAEADRMAIVPHASPKCNAFYMSGSLSPEWMFPFDTPDYGLVARRGAGPPHAPARIALFAVTYPVLRSVRPGFDNDGFEVVEAGSTSDAASMVASGRADYAVSNAEAAEAFGLEFVLMHGPIPMGWTAFTPRATRRHRSQPTCHPRRSSRCIELSPIPNIGAVER